jgi:arabinofuranosyltransferase
METTTDRGPLRKVIEHRVVRRWLAGEGLPRRLQLLLGLVLPMYVLAVNMWRVHRFTVDDAYISFRYAVNLAQGHGLVYNPGERIEGYTNFLWTVLLGGGLKLGLDPHVTAKVLGAAAAMGTLVVVYRLSERLLPYKTLPCVATWLLASSSTFSGYAVFGLETVAFGFLVVLGTLMMFREVERGRGFPWSGLVFALAGLTRPEAPMYAGIPMLLLGRGFFSRQNLLRGCVFAAPLALHLLWRYGYYGAWLPSTLSAKTGDPLQQWKAGKGYVLGWVNHAGAVVFFSFYGLAIGLVKRNREILSLAAVFVGCVVYVLLIGGDWMAYYRFMGPAEPFAFVLVCLGIRTVIQTHDKAAWLAMVLFGAWMVPLRLDHLADAQKKWMTEEKRFWDNAAGQTADWLVTHGKPGRVAIGDIGYVGYRTNYPILDLLGLVDPVISRLPGGYTRKLGKGFKERFFDVEPEWVVIILSGQNCDRAVMKGSRLLYEDPRFGRSYALAQNVQVNADASWCIFKRKDF